MIIRASEVSSAELHSLVRDSAKDLLGQARLGTFMFRHDISLSQSYVAIGRGNYVGVALVAQRLPRLHLCILAVKKGFRGQGLGTALLQQVKVEARSNPLSLDVLSRNTSAVTLYKSHGFRPAQTFSFWYRPLPFRWDDPVKDRVHPIAADIAIKLTEAHPMPWAVEARSLRHRLRSLQGVIYLDNGKVCGASVFSSKAEEIVIYRLHAANEGVAKALLRYMYISTPSASAIYVRWVYNEAISDILNNMGFRCYCVYNTLQIN